jgi:uncharacterized membrane protein YdjX (TVP38/TMEM64 family)
MPEEKKDQSAGGGWVKAVLLFAIWVVLIVALLFTFGGRTWVADLYGWIRGLGPAGPVLFVLLEAIVVLLLLPGFFLTYGGGVLFGVVRGTVLSVAGVTLGATIAFVLSRHFFRRRISRYLLRHPRMSSMSTSMINQGARIIFLTRLVPFFPFKLSNYFFGASGFRLLDFVTGTFFGVIPLAFTGSYAGALTGALVIPERQTMFSSPFSWALYVLGFVASVILVVILGRMAKKSIDASTGDNRG